MIMTWWPRWALVTWWPLKRCRRGRRWPRNSITFNTTTISLHKTRRSSFKRSSIGLSSAIEYSGLCSGHVTEYCTLIGSTHVERNASNAWIELESIDASSRVASLRVKRAMLTMRRARATQGNASTCEPAFSLVKMAAVCWKVAKTAVAHERSILCEISELKTF